jgi:5-methylcytosine-specific restriction endonuclease McrA
MRTPKKEVRAGQKGPKHPLWNSALTEEDRIKQRKLLGLSDWRKTIFARDDFTCQMCGVRGGQLHAHHLNSWHWAKAERLDPDNGITLCQLHHVEFHSRHGKRNNTKEQFLAFVLRKAIEKAA